MAQWIALAAHGHRVVGSNLIRVIGYVRKGIQPQLLLCSRDSLIQTPDQKKIYFRFSQGLIL